jgi:2-polyprenyl-3-methyl-5-hydroxy-6-metoxy-1,4-benzoquinol methylase
MSWKYSADKRGPKARAAKRAKKLKPGGVAMAGKTAITRRKASAPLRKLLDLGLLPAAQLTEMAAGPRPAPWTGATILDYGCGKGTDVEHLQSLGYNAVGWDPNHRDHHLHLTQNTYDVVLCTYVINCLKPEFEPEILEHIRMLLKPGGVAFITVRRDLPKGESFGRTYQRHVELDLPIITRVRKGFITYKLTKE